MGGYLNFHPLANLVFAAFLLFPLSSTLMRRARLLIALPAGVGLFYHDTWLPGIESIMGQGKMVFSFTFDYFLELLGRFINWNMVGVAFVMLTGYLFLARWLRFTPWMLISLLWLTLSPHLASLGLQSPFREAQAQANVPGGAAVAAMPVTASQALDQGLRPPATISMAIWIASTSRSGIGGSASHRPCQLTLNPLMCCCCKSVLSPGAISRRAA